MDAKPFDIEPDVDLSEVEAELHLDHDAWVKAMLS